MFDGKSSGECVLQCVVLLLLTVPVSMSLVWSQLFLLYDERFSFLFFFISSSSGTLVKNGQGLPRERENPLKKARTFFCIPVSVIKVTIPKHGNKLSPALPPSGQS